MARFVSKTPVRVQVDDSEDWVEIKAKLDLGDRQALQRQLMEWRVGVDGAQMSYDPAQQRSAVLKLAVVGWRIVDDDGIEISFDRAMLDHIDPDDPLWDTVSAEIVRRNPTFNPDGEMLVVVPPTTGNES